MFEYTGVIHIHSVFSDGSGEVKEIAAYASEVGLDYLIVTDHNTLRALHEGYEGWYDNTLLLVGCEINDKENKNHYLTFRVKDNPSTRLPAQDIINKVKESGGIGFIAHPHEKRNSMEEHPPYPWTDWNATGFNGIEIWNHMSEWMEGLTEENKYQWFVHPLKSITAPPVETLQKWDELSRTKKVIGIGGADAHAHKVNLFGFFEVEVFPYKVLFKSIRTHVLTSKKIVKGDNPKDIEEAKSLIYDALEYGHCFVSNYYHADASGFRFFAEDGSKIYQMGDTVKLEEKVILRAIQPNVSGSIRLIRNGELYDTVDDYNAEFIIKEKGSYRVEVYLEDKAWIFSNHIKVE